MQSYSFLNGSLLINGRAMTDFDEGDDVINVARRNDAASDVVGADGKMGLAIHADQSGTFVFRIKQTSADSGYLYSLVNAMQTGLFTPVTIQYKDSTRSDLAVGTIGYINKPADLVRGMGMNMQEWTVTVENLSISADETSGTLGLISAALSL